MSLFVCGPTSRPSSLKIKLEKTLMRIEEESRDKGRVGWAIPHIKIGGNLKAYAMGGLGLEKVEGGKRSVSGCCLPVCPEPVRKKDSQS